MIYTFRHEKDPRWYIELQYLKGRLNSIKVNQNLKKLAHNKLSKILQCVAITPEETTSLMQGIGFKAELEAGQTVEAAKKAEKKAIWDKHWLEYLKLPYAWNKRELDKLGTLDLSAAEFDRLLKAYFDSSAWYSKDKSPGAFVAHINKVRAEILAVSKNKYPSTPCKEDESKIKDPNEVMKYRQHFLKQGWRIHKRSGAYISPESLRDI